MSYLQRSVSWLVQCVLRRWFGLVTLFCLYYYHVRLQKDMRCSCESQTRDCRVYLVVPALILTVLQLWVDLIFARVLKFVCGGTQGLVRGRVVPLLIKRVLEAIFVGLLWVQSVLLDGDWYYCCGRGNLRCRRSFPSETRPDSDEIRNESQVIGLLLVLVVFLASAILSWLPWGRWGVSTDWPAAVLEEAELTMDQQFKTMAQAQIQTQLNQSGAAWRKWEELERELLLEQNQEPKQTQGPVLMSSLSHGDGRDV